MWILCVLAISSPASAASIRFQADDLADSNPGEDLWRYTYQVDNATFNSNQGFVLFFDFTSYGHLSNPTPDTDRDAFSSTDSEWDVLLLDPDAGLLADGVFDALALINNPLGSAFSVDFVWLGSGDPGPQAFYFYELDSAGMPVVGPIGVSQPQQGTAPVPEPGTVSLVALGLLRIYSRCARRKSSADPGPSSS